MLHPERSKFINMFAATLSNPTDFRVSFQQQPNRHEVSLNAIFYGVFNEKKGSKNKNVVFVFRAYKHKLTAWTAYRDDCKKIKVDGKSFLWKYIHWSSMYAIGVPRLHSDMAVQPRDIHNIPFFTRKVNTPWQVSVLTPLKKSPYKTYFWIYLILCGSASGWTLEKSEKLNRFLYFGPIFWRLGAAEITVYVQKFSVANT